MLKLNYKFPIQLFVIFETAKPIIFTSQFLLPNHFCFYLPASWLYFMNFMMKTELFFTKGFLIDSSAVDTKNYNQEWFTNIYKQTPASLFLFSSYYFYYLQIKMSVFTFYNSAVTANLLWSVETIYFNANWLERETAEMFGVFYLKKLDNRILLLDYSKNENPMLKSFPCEGFFETYYNFFELNVLPLQIETIEL